MYTRTASVKYAYVGCILGASILVGAANLSAIDVVTNGPTTDFDTKRRENPVTGKRYKDHGTTIEETLSPGRSHFYVCYCVASLSWRRVLRPHMKYEANISGGPTDPSNHPVYIP